MDSAVIDYNLLELVHSVMTTQGAILYHNATLDEFIECHMNRQRARQLKIQQKYIYISQQTNLHTWL